MEKGMNVSYVSMGECKLCQYGRMEGNVNMTLKMYCTVLRREPASSISTGCCHIEDVSQSGKTSLSNEG